MPLPTVCDGMAWMSLSRPKLVYCTLVMTCNEPSRGTIYGRWWLMTMIFLCCTAREYPMLALHIVLLMPTLSDTSCKGCFSSGVSWNPTRWRTMSNVRKAPSASVGSILLGIVDGGQRLDTRPSFVECWKTDPALFLGLRGFWYLQHWTKWCATANTSFLPKSRSSWMPLSRNTAWLMIRDYGRAAGLSVEALHTCCAMRSASLLEIKR